MITSTFYCIYVNIPTLALHLRPRAGGSLRSGGLTITPHLMGRISFQKHSQRAVEPREGGVCAAAVRPPRAGPQRRPKAPVVPPPGPQRSRIDGFQRSGSSPLPAGRKGRSVASPHRSGGPATLPPRNCFPIFTTHSYIFKSPLK